MSLITYNPQTGELETAPKQVLTNRFAELSGWKTQESLLEKYSNAIENPSKYLSDKREALRKANVRAQTIYANRFKLLTQTLPEAEADRLAYKLAEAAWEAEYSIIQAQWPDILDGFSIQHGLAKQAGKFGLLTPPFKIKKSKKGKEEQD